MRQIGLRAEILVNILFITAVAMFLIGIIAFKVTERFAVQGKIESVNAIIAALEDSYLIKNDVEGGIGFLKRALNPGAWGVIADHSRRTYFSTSAGKDEAGKTDPLILESMRTGSRVTEIEGEDVPFLSSYEGIKIATPVRLSGNLEATLLVYQPMSSLEENMALSLRLIALWIILFLTVIALFGFYILSRRVVKPVHELIKTTEKISGGRFPEHTNVGNVKEINQLHTALKVMFDEIESGKMMLRDKIGELEVINAELLQTQKELIAAEKLASLGQLSAGIAHEIGNPLSAIKGYADVLSRAHDMDGDTRMGFINDIRREVDRVDKIIRTLLDYSRPRKCSPRIVDVNQAIKDTVEIVRSQGVLKNISLILHLSDEMPKIIVDPGQMSQVLINLILNSKDAVTAQGEIVIATYLEGDEEAVITVSDNGMGISREIMDKIFDPFFTTKDPGHGTGLGLSVSARIVETFDGSIRVESTEGKGSIFRIIFPAVRGYKNAENFGN